MTAPSVLTIRRQIAEQYIEQLIAILDELDGDPDLEEDDPKEPNGDEQDCSSSEDEGAPFRSDGSGVYAAESMIRGHPDAERRAASYRDAAPPPILYDFRRTRD